VDAVVDRRQQPRGKNLGNRQRFLRRARSHIRRSIRDNLRQRGVSDAEQGGTVSIPQDEVHEPELAQDANAGEREHVLPGNREFVEGDRIQRPPSGGAGSGSQGSDSGEGEDAFTFELTRDEFLDVFFEDLALPDMVKARVASDASAQPHRAGFTTEGPPSRMNLERTMRHSMARRVALGRPTQRALEAIQRELDDLRAGRIQPADGRSAETRIAELEEMLARAHERHRTVPFIDPIDLRYSHVESVPKPVTQAVMFCLMDVSASMDENMKDLAKRFFILLHLFLKRQYERVELVFIRHTQHAQEVDEDAFFHSRQTGGTIVSSALDEMLRVIDERYPVADWNVYLAQASDGDNWREDLARCPRVLSERVLPLCQYAAYVEIARGASAGLDPLAGGESELWHSYDAVVEQHEHFARRRIAEPGDIFPVFRDLFRREGLEA
jgi:uncharacterized sporulation protein YeaH/YhbH (DUF444 family)